VVNSSLTTSQTTHPTLQARAAAELTHIERVQALSAQGVWLVGWQPDAPVGTDALRELATGNMVGRR
jgi:hypothetical protein